MAEVVLPSGAVHERLGIARPSVSTLETPRRRNVNIMKFRGMGAVWLRRSDVLRVLRAEAENTGSPIVAALVKALEEGTA